MADNKLYYGDNLDILRMHVRDESVGLVYLEEPTQPMRTEAAGAGNYQHPLGSGMYPRLQLLTTKELSEGRIDVTFAKAPRAKARQCALGEAEGA
jgi:hypothetical protein